MMRIRAGGEVKKSRKAFISFFAPPTINCQECRQVFSCHVCHPPVSFTAVADFLRGCKNTVR